MISHRCRYKARGSVLIRIFTSSSVRWAAARVTLAISSLFCFRSSPPLFYHSTRIRMRRLPHEDLPGQQPASHHKQQADQKQDASPPLFLLLSRFSKTIFCHGLFLSLEHDSSSGFYS